MPGVSQRYEPAYKEKGHIDFELFMKLIDQLSPALSCLNRVSRVNRSYRSTFTGDGRICKIKKIYVSTSMNGHFMNDENDK